MKLDCVKSCFSSPIFLMSSVSHTQSIMLGNTLNLDTFSRCWNTMFSLSPAARLLWKTRTGTAMRLHSKNRWWSKWEVLNQVMEFFGAVEPFLRENYNLSPVCSTSLLEIFDDPATNQDACQTSQHKISSKNHICSVKTFSSRI